jgi:hypothetical protein
MFLRRRRSENRKKRNKINPEVLKTLRETSGYTIAEIAKN